jgi:hypothetical protein
MSNHRVFIESVYAEELLELPEGVFLRGASVQDGHLVLEVSSEEDLGGADVDALYGNLSEDEKDIHFGMFQARKG